LTGQPLLKRGFSCVSSPMRASLFSSSLRSWRVRLSSRRAGTTSGAGVGGGALAAALAAALASFRASR
jgi:hypothetical protein